MTRILIGSDHGGYNLKNLIKAHLEEHGVEVKDYDATLKIPAIILLLPKK